MHTCTDTHLEAGNASERPLRGTDFSRIVGESGNSVAKPRGNIGEDITCQLHTVTRITGEPYGYLVKRLYSLICVSHDLFRLRIDRNLGIDFWE